VGAPVQQVVSYFCQELRDSGVHGKEVLVSMEKFDRMMENPAMYEVHNSDLTLRDFGRYCGAA
jgi:hypothetical protein